MRRLRSLAGQPVGPAPDRGRLGCSGHPYRSVSALSQVRRRQEVRPAAERGGRLGGHDPPAPQHHGPVGDLERGDRMLLDEQRPRRRGRSAAPRITGSSASTTSGARPRLISSIRSTRGRATRARASANICCSPPDSGARRAVEHRRQRREPVDRLGDRGGGPAAGHGQPQGLAGGERGEQRTGPRGRAPARPAPAAGPAGRRRRGPRRTRRARRPGRTPRAGWSSSPPRSHRAGPRPRRRPPRGRRRGPRPRPGSPPPDPRTARAGDRGAVRPSLTAAPGRRRRPPGRCGRRRAVRRR